MTTRTPSKTFVLGISQADKIRMPDALIALVRLLARQAAAEIEARQSETRQTVSTKVLTRDTGDINDV
tara:strand:- start:292 stop:495 length:204 start_codon:yes stop_codon:yes gene_type:complete